MTAPSGTTQGAYLELLQLRLPAVGQALCQSVLLLHIEAQQVCLLILPYTRNYITDQEGAKSAGGHANRCEAVLAAAVHQAKALYL